MRRPRLRPPLCVVPGPPLHLRGGDHDLHFFDGATSPWLPDLLRLLDGRETEEIVAALPGVGERDVSRAIDRLASAGLLQEGDASAAPRRGRVALAGESPLWCHLRPLLSAEVVASDDELLVAHEEMLTPSALVALNRARLDARRPWLLVSLQGQWARLGPLFVPGETACWGCYRLRLKSNRAHPEAEDAWERMDRAQGCASLPTHESAAASLAAAEVARVLDRHAPPQLAGRLLVLDLESLEGNVETVSRVPGCRHCGA